MRSLEARHAAYCTWFRLSFRANRTEFVSAYCTTLVQIEGYLSVYDTSMRVAWPLSLLKEQSVLLSNPRTVPAAGIVLSQHPTVKVEGTFHGAVKRQWHAESC